MIREAFRGKRVVVTGTTGFLGTAVVEKLLRSVPEVGSIVLPVRAWSADHAANRVRDEVVASPAFGPLREQAGEDRFVELVAKLEAVPMDITRDDGLPDPAPLAGSDIAVHCAATVSFDPPVDEAFETNLKGSLRFFEWSRAAGVRRYVQVSTAYMVGIRRGEVPEFLPTNDPEAVPVNWRTEIEAVAAARREVERVSRMPERLAEFTAQAKREMGPAGVPAVARRAERIRTQWVTDRLVERGNARARALGFPDVYAMTKNLTERALVETRGDVELAIVRPSIIESAIREPFPGWIRGFRVAEPIILAYGRGALEDFPGLPEGIIDIVPVDLAVNCILAAAAAPIAPEDDPPAYHVVSGSRNPLRYGEAFGFVRDYFRDHPLLDEDGQPIDAPDWKFPGQESIRTRLRRGTRALERAQRVLRFLPASGRVRDAVDAVERSRQRVQFLGRYANLYGPYAEFEAVFLDDRARALEDSLDDEERALFPFDPSGIDWAHYWGVLHLPAVAEGRDAPRRRPPAGVVVERAPEGATVLAAFDLEGTVAATNVIE
ncbi:MAG TPA: SDR family oxidoreductase, partial [Actinomycetota bacterium]|nr:SDR family oxidoreductase [Actinomycetota bacterium]